MVNEVAVARTDSSSPKMTIEQTKLKSRGGDEANS
jgi:hypothetical protein